MSDFERSSARSLAVGDRFAPDASVEDATENGWAWTVVSHDLTGRGDYSTFVECDGSTWSERYGPDDVVWIET